MKRYFILVLIIFLPVSLYSQVKQIKYTKYDNIKKQTNPLFGNKSASIEFNLVGLTNLMNDSTTYGVEVNLYTQKNKVVGSSLAFSNLGSLWGASSSIMRKTINNKGFIFLDQNDLRTIDGFMSKAYSLRGTVYDNYIIYKLNLNDRLEIALKYDPEKSNISGGGQDQGSSERQLKRLEFIITINKATYSTSFNDGLEIMRKLIEFQKRLSEFN